METAFGVVTVLFSILVILAIRYLHKLPDRLHEEGVRRLEFVLGSQLESVKASFARELEVLKISQGELQVHKNEELIRLSEFFTEAITNSEKFARIAKQPKLQQEFKGKMFDLGAKLFFFASDETLRAFIAWRHYSQDSDADPQIMLKKYADLMVMIRKEVGHSDTSATWEDFLAVVITDWPSHRPIMLAALDK